jgi:hypothetical protein
MARRVLSRNPKNEEVMARDTAHLGGDVCHPEGGASRSPRNVRTHPHQGASHPGHVQSATSYLVPYEYRFGTYIKKKLGQACSTKEDQ